MGFSKKTKVYGNCLLLAPDDMPLARVSDDRADWYLSRNLGELVQTTPHRVVRLKFEPAGRMAAQDAYFIAEKDNICVACGSNNNLTMHHIVPYCYRRHFPEFLKDHASHDVLPLCMSCHVIYETKAHELKMQITNSLGLVIKKADHSRPKALNYCKTLVNSKDIIPLERQNYMKEKICEWLNLVSISDEEIENLSNTQVSYKDPCPAEHFAQTVDRVDLDEFILTWRKHFVSEMKPKFLPKHWDENRTLEQDLDRNWRKGMATKLKPSRILPQYPRTFHYPYKPNTQRGDLLADRQDADIVFNSPHVYVEEKIDGANCGMALFEGNPIIRNHNNLLNKAFSKATPAKKQFASIWNWFYDNKEKFDKLNELAGEVSVYGEWMFAVHGMYYDYLPDWFVPYDVYNYRLEKFLDPVKAREYLTEAGFVSVPIIARSPILSNESLEQLCHEKSIFSTTQVREGIYIKVSDGEHIINRFKMVREGFVQGGLWSNDNLSKNQLAKNTDKIKSSLTEVV